MNARSKMTSEKLKSHDLSKPRVWRIALHAVTLLAVGALATTIATSMKARTPKPDADQSRAAFLQVYRVLTSPRCQNCHPAGDAPLQGDDSHVHLQNVKRGKDGHGVYGMRCDTCHQVANLPGAHMPPGNPKWALPTPEHKMVFVRRSPAALCAQLKDPKQNGGRSLDAIFDHIANDDLVGWGWNPGAGRTLPPLTRPETVAQLKTWIAGGAACPQ
jgi:mono/diheme cytochrome c family protein